MVGESLILIVVLWPFIAALLSYIIGRFNKEARDFFFIFSTLLEFIIVLILWNFSSNQAPTQFYGEGIAGLFLHFKLDGFRYTYMLITSFMWLMTSIFSKEYFSSHYRNRNRYYFFNLLTLGATVGIMISGNLWTTFIFFEIMSFTSYVLVIHDETKKAINAANAFLAVGVIGGLFMLIGLFMMQYFLGTTEISGIQAALSTYNGSMGFIYAIAILLTLGFGGKAGMYPLHFWLPKAHPVAPAPASALLSGILTKAGVFGLLVVGGNLLLHNYDSGLIFLIFGTITMFWGAFLALFSIDLKRTLALSSVSQIGFIIVGIGMQGILGDHNAIAVRGTILHMVNHSLIKLVLFMCAGAIYMKLHSLDLNDLRGYGRGKNVLMIAFAMGTLSLMSVPLWSGYVSKTLLHESIVEYIWMLTEYSNVSFFFKVVESLFTLTGGFTVAYMLKIFIAIFVERNPYKQNEHDALNNSYMTRLSKIAIIIPAFLVFLFGFSPQIMDNIADFTQSFVYGHAPAHTVQYFAWINLKGAIASISIGVITYLFFIRNILMEKDENGHSIYVQRRLDSVLYFSGKISKGILLGLFNLMQYALSIISKFPDWFGNLLIKISQFITTVVSILPGWIASEGLLQFKRLNTRFYKPFEAKGEKTYLDKDEKNSESPSLDKIVTSSLNFSLIQFSMALVLILLILFLLQ